MCNNCKFFCLENALFDNMSSRGAKERGGERTVSFVSDLIACTVVELCLVFQKHYHCDLFPVYSCILKYLPEITGNMSVLLIIQFS